MSYYRYRSLLQVISVQILSNDGSSDIGIPFIYIGRPVPRIAKKIDDHHFVMMQGCCCITPDVLTSFFHIHLCTFPHSTAGGCIQQIYIACNSFSAFFFLHTTMATVWLRHPRYSLLVFVTLITTFYLLFVPREQQHHVFTLQDNSLDTRVQRSHTIYDKLLVQRQGLIKKFGPTPKDIAL